MKKVLYILDDGKRSFTYARIAGFRDAIKQADEPIDLYVFRSAGFAEYEAMHNCGEYNIYHLPNFSDFDGIFLDINNYHSSTENMYGAKGASYVIRTAAASRKPVISLANRIADFYYVGIDNHAAMTSMISYLHEERGLTDFWFLMGPVDNYENRVRTQALREYCQAHGIPAEDDRFHAESYMVESGIHGFNALCASHKRVLPQAIVCANDSIAVGAIRAIQAAGFSVPGDVFVTGFDNLDMSAYLSPTITTVDQLRWTMGTACIEVMQKIWRGEEVPITTYTPTHIILRESTGAEKPSEALLTERVAESLGNEMYTEAFTNQLCTLQYRLPSCESVEEMCHALERCIPTMKCRGIWLVLDKEVYDYGSQIDYDQSSGNIVQNSNSSLHTEGYPEEMEMVFAWEEDMGSSYPKKPIRGLFPTFESEEGGRDYLFVPLHFMESTVGYLVIWDCVELLHTRNIAPIVNTMTMAMRNFFAGKKLEYLNQMLSGISMMDNLTGLCNRLGYHHLASRLFNRVHAQGRSLGVLFIDMDKMKYFNDTFGHACGDDAICTISAAIQASISKEAIPVRFGGDEFIVFSPASAPQDIVALRDQILEAIPGEAAKRNLPSIPGISTGYVITDPHSSLTLNDYVEEADKLMYNDKKARRAGRS